MKHLTNHNIKNRISFHNTRFLSFLIPLQTPQRQSNFNPYSFLNDSTKSHDLTLQETKIIHTRFLISNLFNSNPEIPNFLLRNYSKASAFDYVLKVFDVMPHPNITSWNLVISCQNQNFRYLDGWDSFCKLRSLGFNPNQFTYGSVISACIGLELVNGGRLVYSLALKHGFSLDGYVRSKMIDLFLKCGGFDDALRVFYDEDCGNVVCWNAIISSAVKRDEDDVGLNLFRQMCSGFPSPNKFTFPSVFAACAKKQELGFGRGVHGLVVKYGKLEDIVVGTAIVDFYAKCGQIDDALKTFSRMDARNVVSWTAIITGFVQKGEFQSALELFKEMIILKEEINNYTVTSVLSACANPMLFNESCQIHCWIYKNGFYSDLTVKSSLINLYAKTGRIELSEQVFRDMKGLMNPSIYGAMINAFFHNGTLDNGFSLLQLMFREGLKPDTTCILSLLSIIDHLELGEQVHSYTLKTGIILNPLVSCSLFTMYSKCGSINESYEIFKQIQHKDNVSWTSMIAGFTEHGYAYQAIELSREMLLTNITFDETTLTAVLAACSFLGVLKIGKEIHGLCIRQQDSELVYGGSSVANMYSRCGDLKSARRVFSMMPFKDKISCSSLVSGYAQSGNTEEALHLFLDLIASGLKVDSFTISSVVGCVGNLAHSDLGIGIGIQLHSYILKLGFESEPSVGSSLVKMYSKCGNLDDSQKGFDQIIEPDLISWTIMINCYAQYGKGLDALKVYELMTKAGTKPDSVTFVDVLTACSHAGLVDEGYSHLKSMVEEHGIRPGQRHYACMVDILGRNGRLKEAERFISSMPIEPDALVWGTLLAACKVHGDVEIGKLAAEKFIELESSSDVGYVAISNICADFGLCEKVSKIRNEMKGTRIKKQSGWSYV
uniref:pentatricopeptide repeat-containing protein At1g74600, chloroplastic n=1 Tax=Erigeron canadensis TaxID=72917 RepID=UPI001CB94C96|nr:pentatricopeptide repeat-containing protein At1g74600, chloroplastic [Erigeron canadensis]